MQDMILKLESLEKQINLIQNNVNFTLGLTWTILGVVVAIIGFALYFLVRMWFNRRFEEEAFKIDGKIKNFVLKNPQFYSQTGKSIIPVERNEDGKCFLEIVMRFDEKLDISFPPQMELYYENNKKELVKLNDFSIVTESNMYGLNKNDFIINFEKYKDVPSGHKERILHYNIIWQNNFL